MGQGLLGHWKYQNRCVWAIEGSEFYVHYCMQHCCSWDSYLCWRMMEYLISKYIFRYFESWSYIFLSLRMWWKTVWVNVCKNYVSCWANMDIFLKTLWVLLVGRIFFVCLFCFCLVFWRKTGSFERWKSLLQIEKQNNCNYACSLGCIYISCSLLKGSLFCKVDMAKAKPQIFLYWGLGGGSVI